MALSVSRLAGVLSAFDFQPQSEQPRASPAQQSLPAAGARRLAQKSTDGLGKVVRYRLSGNEHLPNCDHAYPVMQAPRGSGGCLLDIMKECMARIESVCNVRYQEVFGGATADLRVTACTDWSDIVRSSGNELVIRADRNVAGTKESVLRQLVHHLQGSGTFIRSIGLDSRVKYGLSTPQAYALAERFGPPNGTRPVPNLEGQPHIFEQRSGTGGFVGLFLLAALPTLIAGICVGCWMLSCRRKGAAGSVAPARVPSDDRSAYRYSSGSSDESKSTRRPRRAQPPREVRTGASQPARPQQWSVPMRNLSTGLAVALGATLVAGLAGLVMMAATAKATVPGICSTTEAEESSFNMSAEGRRYAPMFFVGTALAMYGVTAALTFVPAWLCKAPCEDPNAGRTRPRPALA